MNGIHMEYRECFMEARVFDTLLKVEESHPGIGRSMLSTFFPHGIRESQETQLRQLEAARSGHVANSNTSAPANQVGVRDTRRVKGDGVEMRGVSESSEAGVYREIVMMT
jgi:hypothetical protein